MAGRVSIQQEHSLLLRRSSESPLLMKMMEQEGRGLIYAYYYLLVHTCYIFIFCLYFDFFCDAGEIGSSKLSSNWLHVQTFTTWDFFCKGGKLMHLRKLCRFWTLFSGSSLLPGLLDGIFIPILNSECIFLHLVIFEFANWFFHVVGIVQWEGHFIHLIWEEDSL